MFDIKKNPVVGYVAADGSTRLAIVNGVSEAGNPILAVVKQVPDAQLDESKAPGTYHLLGGEEIKALQSAPVESAPVESAPVESAPVESAPTEAAPTEAAP